MRLERRDRLMLPFGQRSTPPQAHVPLCRDLAPDGGQEVTGQLFPASL